MATLDRMEAKEGATPLRRRTDAAPEHGQAGDAHPLLSLGRHVGNAQIARMIAQREGAPEQEDEEKTVQAKHDASLQREGAPEEDEENKPLQAKAEVGLEGGPVSDGLAQRINTQRGGGAPLDGGTRDRMEGALGAPLDDVRVHHNEESDALNRSISAKAFTTGSDIFFRKDASPADGELMAHELTHVVQQRSMAQGGPMTVGPAGDSYEQEADATTRAVSSGAASNGPGAALGASSGTEGVQRAAAPEEEEAAAEA